LILSPEQQNQNNQQKLQSKTLQMQTEKDDSGRVGFMQNGCQDKIMNEKAVSS
jgi:hypothetical protein